MRCGLQMESDKVLSRAPDMRRNFLNPEHLLQFRSSQYFFVRARIEDKDKRNGFPAGNSVKNEHSAAFALKFLPEYESLLCFAVNFQELTHIPRNPV